MKMFRLTSDRRLDFAYSLHVFCRFFFFSCWSGLCVCFVLQSRRAIQKNMVYIDDQRVMMKYLFPLNEIVVDFYDQLKSVSSGYAR